VKEDRFYLISIIESAERIVKYVEGGLPGLKPKLAAILAGLPT
jgi:hypothetical protein